MIPIGNGVDGIDDANVVHDASFRFVVKCKARPLLGVCLGEAFRLGCFRCCIRCHREVSAGSDQGMRGLLE